MISLTVAIALLSADVAANAQSPQHIAGKLICTAHSGNPSGLRAFQGDMVFELSDGHFAATRKLANGPGEETFTGTATSMGDILVTGVGGGRNGSTWNYEFHGTRDDKSDTKIKGRMTLTNGLVGYRDCSIVFFKPRSL
jgi:hypothetical protein